MAEHESTGQHRQIDGHLKHNASRRKGKPGESAANRTATHYRPGIEERGELLAGTHSAEQRADMVARLQQTYGNRYVRRLMTSLRVQAKLSVSAPDDAHELEADRAAEKAVGSIGLSVQREEVPEEQEAQSKADLQRQVAPEEEEEDVQTKALGQRQAAPEKEEVQAKPAVQAQNEGPVAEVLPEIEAGINSARGSGGPLDDAVRAPMERSFGADFSGVRVHTDAGSDALNQSLQARAFTTGKDIFFREGEYSPSSAVGQQLIAHELAHTIQQGSAKRVSRWLGKGHSIITALALEQVGKAYSSKAKDFLADRAGQMDQDPDTFLKMRVGQGVTKVKVKMYHDQQAEVKKILADLRKARDKRDELKLSQAKIGWPFKETRRNRTAKKITAQEKRIAQLTTEGRPLVADMKQKWESNWLHTRYSTHHPEHGEAGAYQEGGKANDNAAKVNEKIVKALALFNEGSHWGGLQILADALHGAEDRGAHGEGEPYSGHDTRLKFADADLIFPWEKIALSKPRKDKGDWTDNLDMNSGEVPKSLSMASFVLTQFQGNLSEEKKKRLSSLGVWWRFWEKGKPAKYSPTEPKGSKEKYKEFATEGLPEEPAKELGYTTFPPWLAALVEKLFVGRGIEGTNMTLNDLRDRYPVEEWKDYEAENKGFMDRNLAELLREKGPAPQPQGRRKL